MRFVFSRTKKIFLITSIAFLLAAVMPIAGVRAQGSDVMPTSSLSGVQDFVINTFSVNYELNNSDPQGSLLTKEKIDVTFKNSNRGILRAIPTVYGNTDTNPRIIRVERNGKTEPYITYEENDNMVVRIGEESTYITGKHTYYIEYEVENVIRFEEKHDELYWDVNGDQWLQSVEEVSVRLDSEVNLSEPTPICFTGKSGDTGTDCSVVPDVKRVDVETTRKLSGGETLTLVVAFDKGYFTPMGFLEKNRNMLIAIPIVGLQLWVLQSAHRKWKTYGKDYKKRGVIVPYYDRPKNSSVLQTMYVAENGLTSKHITAGIIDLAIRGYIQIKEEKKRFSTKHDLILIKNADAHISEDEAILLNDIFSSGEIGETIRLEDKKNKLYKTVENVKKKLDDMTVAKGYYELSPRKSAGKMGGKLALSVFAMVAGFIFFESTKGVSAIVGVSVFIMVIIYMGLMTKRSKAGNMLVEHYEGLKLYIDKAEKDRIAAHDAVAAPLSVNNKEPIRDVKFFEKLLPFAIAAGLEKTWAKAFEGIYKSPPDWYAGNWSTFSTVALANSISSTAAASAASFSAPSSSGGSGFSGGGSAGGGGGGGGGGGW